MIKVIRFVFPYLLMVSIVSIIFSCGSGGGQQTKIDENTLSNFDSAQGRSFTYSKYELPLSIDIYKFLVKEKIPFNLLLMHKLKDQDKYFTETKRAFAMGIYSSDLAYTAVYDQNQEAVEYFAATIELANKLLIQEGYNPETLDRAYKSLGNEDSLASIVAESYYKTCNALEKNKRDNILPLIVVGSWIESMHILSRNCIGSVEGSVIFAELYQQLKQLDNLILFVKDSSNEIKNSNSKSEMLAFAQKLELINQKYKEIDASNPASFKLGHFKDVIFQIEELRNSMLE
jgi:hypothetical protein